MRSNGTHNHYCLWFIQPHDGRVRKLRFSPRAILSGIGFVALAILLVAFTAGDYARVQILRAKNFLFLEQVTRERDELLAVKDSLRQQVESLRSENDRAQSYEKSVKERLDALASILDASRSLGLPDAKSAPSNRDGVGGPESDCSAGSRICSPSVDPSVLGPTVPEGGDEPLAMFNPAAMRRDLEEGVHTQAELLTLLDNYIAALRIFPLATPARGRVSSGFGYRNSPFKSGSIRLHEGIDISLPYGSHVYSTGDGVVAAVKRTGTYGLVIDIAHNSRIISRYAHLSRALVKEGDRVHRGSVIGHVGSSGHSTGPHLHYEVLVDGRAKDPQKFLALAERIATVF
jgi:murein DD-endopeptidase MepM/ murein hydrolase activator NlpD